MRIALEERGKLQSNSLPIVTRRKLEIQSILTGQKSSGLRIHCQS